MNIIRWVVAASILVMTAGCEKAFDLQDPATDSVAIFDETWKIINERYALFPVKKINWDSKYQEFRSQIRAGMPEAELFSKIADMLETLNDGHVSLTSGNQTRLYDNFYKPFPVNFSYSTITKNYLGNSYSTSGPLIYKVVQNTGYIYYNSFANDITEEQLNKVFDEISQTKGLIVDVRSNTGGNSGNAVKLFSRFISQRTQVKLEVRKSGSGHNEFYAPDPFFVMPSGTVYNKPIIVLTNRSCFSTCNDFVSYMSLLPNTTQIGDQTGGGGGIPQSYLLGNGWEMRYTSTLTLTPDKKSIEEGIAPDIAINISSFDETTGRDPILERAFQILQ